MTLALATLVVPALLAQSPKPVETVDNVDLERYAGDWYEVARFPNRFQDQCAGDVRVTYRRRSDGRIDVINRCRKSDGEIDVANGIARVVDQQTNAQLEVRFAPAFLSWLPMVWGDYWIIGLDADYQWAVVGDPSRKYLWILSRTPVLDSSAFSAAVERARTQGFDTARLERTENSTPGS
jgi:apolipoprotein D and lipocalin family protein